MKRTPLSRNTIVLAEIGPPCRRCRQPTEVRAHKEITDRELRRGCCYLSKWYQCCNPACRTGQINDNAYLVHPRRTHFKLSRKAQARLGLPPIYPAPPRPDRSHWKEKLDPDEAPF